MTILAVGAAGRFAGHVVPALAARNARVRGLVRKPEAAPSRVGGPGCAQSGKVKSHDYQENIMQRHSVLPGQLGFDAAVSSAWGSTRAGADLFQIPRFTPWDRPHWRFGLRLAMNLLGNHVVRA